MNEIINICCNRSYVDISWQHWNMANENTDRRELSKPKRKKKLSIENTEKEIFSLVDHFIAK